MSFNTKIRVFSSVMLIAMIMISCDKKADPEPEDPEFELPDNLPVSEAILELVNQHRLSENLNELELSTEAEESAILHSSNMANGLVDFGHDGSDERFDALGEATGATGFGENVAFGQKDAEDVMEAWLNSSGHRANIEGDFTHLGVGVVEDENGSPYYTQIFLKIE